MDFFSLILVALGLSMDAFAVAISSALSTPDIDIKKALKVGTCFGLFQAVMPILGWQLGKSISGYIQVIDHWVAFALLSFIGISMIVDSIRSKDTVSGKDMFAFRTLFIMGIATSIDALVVGLSLALVQVNMILSAMMIGVITFAVSVIGVMAGKKLGAIFEERAEAIGGIVLVGIGVKILFEHIFTV